MSRIQQLAEHAQMRERIRELDLAMRGMSLVFEARLAQLEQAIEELRSIAKPLESPKRPGRPRKEDGGIAPGGNRTA